MEMGATLFSFFILRLTRVDRLMEEMTAWRAEAAVSQASDRQAAAEARDAGSTCSSRRIRSLAAPEMLEKCSLGKLKSARRMLLVVSSSESSRNGESPLRRIECYVFAYG
jgi:hypothetical protein